MPKISFIPINEAVTKIINPPIPANNFLPDWYKNQAAFTSDKITLNDTGNVNTTIKKCMPVLDDITAGYYIVLASDVLVSKDEDNNPSFGWSLDLDSNFNPKDSDKIMPSLITVHSKEQVSNLPIPLEYSPFPFKFNNYYRIKTPEGYSCLFRHPSWWFDLPFYTLSGIVDTDKHPIPVNFPFLIKENWEGIIPEGTPIAQVIPFIREEWEYEIIDEPNDLGADEFRKASKKMMHRYKDNWRSKKIWK